MNRVDISLYAILDPEHTLDRDLGDLALLACENGTSLLQYRDKLNDTKAMIANVRHIQNAIKPTGVKLLINDRVDVALVTNADGVHLGQSDMPIKDARTLLGPNALIGLSIKTLNHANSAPVDLLDYAFIGGVHPTNSKDNKTHIGVSGWQERAAILRAINPAMPLGAIAGFTLQNTAEIIKAGADGIAVISALFKADNVAKTSLELSTIIKTAKQQVNQ